MTIKNLFKNNNKQTKGENKMKSRLTNLLVEMVANTTVVVKTITSHRDEMKAIEEQAKEEAKKAREEVYKELDISIEDKPTVEDKTSNRIKETLKKKLPIKKGGKIEGVCEVVKEKTSTDKEFVCDKFESFKELVNKRVAVKLEHLRMRKLTKGCTEEQKKQIEEVVANTKTSIAELVLEHFDNLDTEEYKNKYVIIKENETKEINKIIFY